MADNPLGETLMLEAWLAGAMLVLESNNVIHMRVLKLAAGGDAAHEEATLMVNEKVAAVLEAQTSMMSGASIMSVIERYREHVAANAKRLSA